MYTLKGIARTVKSGSRQSTTLIVKLPDTRTVRLCEFMPARLTESYVVEFVVHRLGIKSCDVRVPSHIKLFFERG